MKYRAIQRDDLVAAPIAGIYSTRSKVIEAIKMAGFDSEDYFIQTRCDSCGMWYETFVMHQCDHMLTHKPRKVRRSYHIKRSVLVKDYTKRGLLNYAFGLGLMVSVKELSHDTEHICFTVYGTKNQVYRFLGYVDRLQV